jgi:hypothetical protein
MRSLIASYYHRRSLRLDNESKQAKQDATKHKITESTSTSTNSAVESTNPNSNKQIDASHVSNDENTLPFDLNIKFIDDADTDASISQSDCEDSNEASNKFAKKIHENSKLYLFIM